MEVFIAGMPASGVIIALVEGAKGAGLPARWAPLVAVLLGVGCGLAGHLAAVAPAFGGWVEAAGSGVILGLAATGLYAGTKAVARG
jgi:hypothetical protein